MSYLDEISGLLPMDQLAAATGASDAELQEAISVVLPALVSGMDANAQDPAAASSLVEALSQHDGSIADGPIDLQQINQTDGAAITQHVFGNNTEAVINQLGAGTSAGSGLVKKLLPILAPIVLGYLAKRLGQGGGALGDILAQVLKGASQGSSTTATNSSGDVLGDLLGGLLGAGTR